MNSTKKEIEIKVLVDVLFEEYKSLTLPPDITSTAMGRSQASLKRDRDAFRGTPFTKLGQQTGSDKVLYNIYDIAKFIVSRKTKVAR